MRRELRELEKITAHYRARSPRQMTERRRSVIIVLGVVALCLGAGLAASLDLSGSRPGSPAFSREPSWPGRPTDSADKPLGTPPPVGRGAGSYAFIGTQDGSKTPVTYDPCVPIHVVVNDRTAVPGARRLLEQSLTEVEKATGLAFVLDAPTDEKPSKDRPPESSKYGDGWVPVLVAWSDPKETPALAGGVAGVGGSLPVERDGHTWFVTGSVTLDGPQLNGILASPTGNAEVRAVIMHEFGHVVGLAHVDAPDELMQPKGSPRLTTWGPGDREGLAALGSGACVDYGVASPST